MNKKSYFWIVLRHRWSVFISLLMHSKHVHRAVIILGWLLSYCLYINASDSDFYLPVLFLIIPFMLYPFIFTTMRAINFFIIDFEYQESKPLRALLSVTLVVELLVLSVMFVTPFILITKSLL